MGWWTGDTLPGYVLRQGEKDPGAEAVVAPGIRLTRGQLATQVSNAAAAFSSLGVRPGERVLVQLPNEPAAIVVILALAQIGAAAILAVPGLRERELRHVTDTGQACAVVVSGRAQRGVNLAVARTLAADCPSVRHLVVSGPTPTARADEIPLQDLIARPAGPAGTAPGPDPAAAALYLLSGGTTGLPKLIPRTHRDYVLNLKVSAALTGLDETSRYLAALPVCHNFALGCPGVLGTLAEGGRVVLTEAQIRRRRPRADGTRGHHDRRRRTRPGRRLGPAGRGGSHVAGAAGTPGGRRAAARDPRPRSEPRARRHDPAGLRHGRGPAVLHPARRPDRGDRRTQGRPACRATNGG